MPRSPRIATFLVSLALLTSVSFANEESSSQRRPNVILILADDLGFETLGSYGGISYQTPVLDTLAATGVRFANAHALPLCSPTRISLMTGKYNWRNWHSFGILPPETKTFGHWLSAAGYSTCIAGKWQLQSYNPPEFMPELRGIGQRVEDAGFDEYFLYHDAHTEDKGSRYYDPKINNNGNYLTDTEDKYGPDLFADYIIDFIERKQDQPFFVYYPMALPHGPFNPTPDSAEWHTEKRRKSSRKHFGEMVAYMDKLVGRIVDHVDKLGLREDTLIIFYGDNGSPIQVTSSLSDGRVLKGGKGQNTLAGTHVPLIVSIPGYAKAGHVADTLVDSNDILPTIFEFCEIPLPNDEPFDGESFLAQIGGESGTHRDWLFFHHDPFPGHKKTQFKYERWAIDTRWKLRETDGRFYDLSVDPQELDPIDMKNASPEAIAGRTKLQAVIDSMGLDYEPWSPTSNR